MPLITGCKVVRILVENGTKKTEDVITSPTKAEIFNDNTPQINIVVTGGTRNKDHLKKSNNGFTITGKVGENQRTFSNFKCDDAGTDQNKTSKFKK